MSNILVLNSSVLGHASVSRVLVEEAFARLTDVDPGQRLFIAISAPHPSRI